MMNIGMTATKRSVLVTSVLSPLGLCRWLLLFAFCLAGFVWSPTACAQVTYQLLKSFGTPGTGGYPVAGLLQGSDGALYGTAQSGGSLGNGTVFKLNPDGTGFTVLKNFDSSTTGGYPQAGLLQGTDGALYGTASQGGSLGYGTVFKLNPDGTGFTVLKNFDNSTTGGYLHAGLLQGTDGALYGTAYQGGSSGVGTVFRLVLSSGTVYSIR